MSTLKPYPFPTLYACYLLKSLRTARSYKNYIGVTYKPMYRLQQHNGNRPGGARGTALHRPWAMQLLVHGFPSFPAAMLFEYAWQNPHKSRYTRDEAGFLIFEESGRTLRHNIMILQKMIRMFPFSKWPLHVKLFTKEAACYWIALASTSPSSQFHVRSSDDKSITFENELLEKQARKNDEMQFPPGFTYSIELSGLKRSRRLLRINDRPYLAKTEALVSLKQPISCSICAEPVKRLAKDHFGTAICTHSDCTSVAHLQCLSKSWLDEERHSCSSLPTSFSSHSSSSPSISSYHSSIDLPASAIPASNTTSSTLSSDLVSTRLSPSSSVTPTSSLAKVSTPRSVRVGTKLSLDPHHQLALSDPFGLSKGTYPRGGTCPSCGTYTLWGDIIQGCFSRSSSSAGRTVPIKRNRTHSLDQHRQTKDSVLKDLSDSGAGTPCLTHFDMLTLQDTSRKLKRKSRSSRISKPLKRHLLAQKKELDLAKLLVEGYLPVIRREQQLRRRMPFEPFKPGLLPRKRRRARKIVRLTETTGVLPLKERGSGRPKEIVDTPDLSLTKRGRGRPKKVLAAPVIPLIKRSPGRPKKALTISAPLTKRGPGRPKKILVTPDLSLTKRSPGRPKKFMDTSVLPSTKPGRGRPKKVLATTVIPVKRGPGRPKKVLAISVPLKKRGPGRPKKIVATTVKPAKRGRGRPKKILVASESSL
ncbi:hypothetical protein AGABI2DRAFT_117837 [Agaricus bisporus var. bisporus H97]|uniref:hypothetical protein n=1 Tax=Agaricus bisporus var. bisporus (strain H97 / ATCC MYA-4626 / FGSC 10389) TaxID=936046 RepID=UPI00029F7700|nr:hypothetical protein AGABI2DRAFT_117837 [Agaricus bisporus var. bisporus H97]EKV47269.1 hypothetical protein AGABI2DRAFT_117837 [Agaricus bisporus var. bisporus H97]